MSWRRWPGWKKRLAAYGGLFGFIYLLGFWMTHSPRIPPGPDSASPELARRLQGHVAVLAGTIGERNFWRASGLSAAKSYVVSTFTELGHPPKEYPFVAHGVTCVNLESELAGTAPSEAAVLVGAHYDTALACPGADDNASGVAALFELARGLENQRLKRTVRFVAFTNEEPPNFETETMGSRVYAAMARHRGDALHAMLSLETLGYYSSEPKSQKYPRALAIYYPDVGDFIGVVGCVSGRGLALRVHRYLSESQSTPVLFAAPFQFIPGVTFSDHASFWREGYSAVMITDTAPYRNPHYHRPLDTPETLNYEKLARVTAGLTRAVAALANE